MHLGEPELARDPALAQVAEVVEVDDPPLPPGQSPEAALDKDALVPGRGRRLLDSDVERHRSNDDACGAVGACDAHRLTRVAEMVSNLPDDRGHGVGGERGAARGIEAVDRLDQSHGTDLGQVLELLAARVEAAGNRADERQVLLDQRAPGVAISMHAPRGEQVAGRCHHVSTIGVSRQSCKRHFAIRMTTPEKSERKWLTLRVTGYFTGVTRSGSARRAARTAVVLAALGLAVTAAPQALAAEGGAPPLLDATGLAAGTLEQAGLGDVLPTLPAEPVTQPLDVTFELPAATAQQAAAEPVSTGAGAAPPPAPVTAPAPEPLEQAVAPPPPAPDSPPAPEPPASAQAAPTAAQDEPANLNVSVRIDSAGDEGPVTQVNVAAGTPPEQYRPDASRYQPVVPTDMSVDEPAAPSQAADEPAWEWEVSPGCGGEPAASVSAPSQALTRNWIWKWRWNCASDESENENTDLQSPKRYHPSTGQYRPVNINVSIRINSPGNNGPVVQTNVAVAVSVPSVPAVVVSAPAEPPAASPAAEPAVADPSVLDFPEGMAEVVALSTLSADEGFAENLEDCCLLPRPRGLAFAAERPAPPVAGGDAGTVTGTAPLPGDPVAVAARLELRLAVQRRAPAAAAPPRPQLRPAHPGPRRRSGGEAPAVVTESGLGITPVGGPDRSLPFVALVLLGFLFASAGSSLASVRSRPTPGADADDPPDRPG